MPLRYRGEWTTSKSSIVSIAPPPLRIPSASNSMYVSAKLREEHCEMRRGEVRSGEERSDAS